jgi:hypothetical protein
MTMMIVETTYDPPLTDDQRARDQEKLDPCLALRSVRWLMSFESVDRRRKICLFRAPDADALREALRGAGIPYDRMWAADWRDPEPADPSGHAVRVTR